MSLTSQKHLFNLPDEVAYLNCAYMGPSLKASMRAGAGMMERLSQPYSITAEDFFSDTDTLRALYARLINSDDADRVALVPSVSYGTANVVRNIRPDRGSNVVMAFEEFPSSVHPWRRLCEDFGCELRLVQSPSDPPGRARSWNDVFLAAIDDRTAAVVAAPLHWTDGSLFDLVAVRDACKRHRAVFVIDGSQWVGARPFDVQELRPDAVVNAGYKWLFSPYGASYAWYGDYFDDGIPIEENWITHEDNRDFSRLVESKSNLLPKGLKYSAGQHPSLVYVAMQIAALEQILAWGVDHISDYVNVLHGHLINAMPRLREWVEEDAWRARHLFGIHFGEDVDVAALKAKLDQEKLYVSQRGNALRISLNVWNTVEDVERLAKALSHLD